MKRFARHLILPLATSLCLSACEVRLAYLIEPYHVITAQQLHAVAVGTSAADVRRRLGEPATQSDARWEYSLVRPAEPTLLEQFLGQKWPNNGEVCSAAISFSNGAVASIEVWDCTRLAEPVSVGGTIPA